MARLAGPPALVTAPPGYFRDPRPSARDPHGVSAGSTWYPSGPPVGLQRAGPPPDDRVLAGPRSRAGRPALARGEAPRGHLELDTGPDGGRTPGPITPPRRHVAPGAVGSRRVAANPQERHRWRQRDTPTVRSPDTSMSISLHKVTDATWRPLRPRRWPNGPTVGRPWTLRRRHASYSAGTLLMSEAEDRHVVASSNQRRLDVGSVGRIAERHRPHVAPRQERNLDGEGIALRVDPP